MNGWNHLVRRREKLLNLSSLTPAIATLLLVISLGTNSRLAVASPSNDEPNCEVAQSAIKRASKLRGLRLKMEVPCTVQNKEQVAKYLKDALAEKIPKVKLKAESIAFRLLGIIPDDFNYEEGLIELYTDQIGGYYDPSQKRYVMAAWLPSFTQEAIAIHELTHALQDQHFDLEKFNDHTNLTTDQQLARAALVEGDATAIMTDHSLLLTGQKPVSELEKIGPMMFQNILGMVLMPTANAAPSLQMIMLFPYMGGLKYVHGELQKGGYKHIDSLYKNPPRSTAEILHSKPVVNDAPEPDLNCSAEDQSYTDAQLTKLPSDTLGEFMVSTILSTALPATVATKAAKGWEADRLTVCTGANKDAIAFSTRWETAKDLDEFVSAVEAYLTKRFGAQLQSSEIRKWTSKNYRATLIAIPETRRAELRITRLAQTAD